MSEEWYEKCQEKLDGDLAYYIADGEPQDFLIWLEGKLGGEMYEKMLVEWVATKEGQKWYAQMLDKLYRDVPDAEPEDMGADR